MSTNCVKGYNIYDGPSRDRLFDACKYAYEEDQINLDFKVAICYSGHLNDRDRKDLPMCITDMRLFSVGHEDGSGHSFVLEGDCKADLSLDKVVTSLNYQEYDIKAYRHKYFSGDYEGKDDLKYYHFSAYYNTNTRKGYITFR